MPDTLELWTAERVRALPDDGKRYEVVDGELLVTQAPRLDHQRAVAELLFALRTYLQRVPVGEGTYVSCRHRAPQDAGAAGRLRGPD